MSYTYRYNFTSPEPFFAQVKEDLRSYFNTGIVDDVMFPQWAKECVQRIGKTAYQIEDYMVKLDDYVVKLPEDFKLMREIHSCQDTHPIEMNVPGFTYVNKSIVGSEVVFDRCKGCIPDCINVVEKITGSIVRQYRISKMLKPGNIHTLKHCVDGCNTGSADAFDSFDIVDTGSGKDLIVKFREGYLFISYYREAYDEEYNNLIPDFYEFHNFLRAYLKYRSFETIFNNVTDESFKIVQAKLQFYKQQYDEAFIVVKTEMMKKTTYQQVKDIKKGYQRFREYEIK